MATETGSQLEPSALDGQVRAWRRDQLLAAAFPAQLADRLAADRHFDLHALIELVERGCEPALAVRILAPLGDEAAHDPTHER